MNACKVFYSEGCDCLFLRSLLALATRHAKPMPKKVPLRMAPRFATLYSLALSSCIVVCEFGSAWLLLCPDRTSSCADFIKKFKTTKRTIARITQSIPVTRKAVFVFLVIGISCLWCVLADNMSAFPPSRFKNQQPPADDGFARPMQRQCNSSQPLSLSSDTIV